MTVENRQIDARLGWGIIGTADGYQWSSEGADKQFSLASTYWDLPSNIADALPAPEEKHLQPLYCLTSLTLTTGERVTAVCQYFSIRQQGSYRAGTFFGAFIDVVDANFSGNETSAIFSALKTLSSYQYLHFIDSNTNSYQVDIRNKHFEQPWDALQAVSSQLRSAKDVVLIATDEPIFIQCQDSQQDELLRLLLQSDLRYKFSHIYFSSSEKITENFAKKVRIELLQASSVIPMQKNFLSIQHQYQQKIAQKDQQIAQKDQQIAALEEQLQQQTKVTEFGLAVLENSAKLAPHLFTENGVVTQRYQQLLNEKEQEIGSLERQVRAISNQSDQRLDELAHQNHHLKAQLSKLSDIKMVAMISAGLALVFLVTTILVWSHPWNEMVDKVDYDQKVEMLQRTQADVKTKETEISQLKQAKIELEDELDKAKKKQGK